MQYNPMMNRPMLQDAQGNPQGMFGGFGGGPAMGPPNPGAPPQGFAFSPAGVPGGMGPPQMPGSPPILAPNQSVREMGAKPMNPRYPQKPAYDQPMDGEMARRRRFGQALMRREQKPAPGQTPPTWNPTNPGGIAPPQSTF